MSFSFAFTHTYTLKKLKKILFVPKRTWKILKNVQKRKNKNSTLSHVTCGWLQEPLMAKISHHMVQNLYSERYLSIQTIVGKKRKKKTNISPFPGTHTYIKLTLVSLFSLFFAPFPWLGNNHIRKLIIIRDNHHTHHHDDHHTTNQACDDL